MAQYIDKSALVAEIKSRIFGIEVTQKSGLIKKRDAEARILHLKDILSLIDSLEVKEIVAEQECTCNEALNRIVGGSWNLLCPVNKLGLKTGDKVKVIIKAQKG